MVRKTCALGLFILALSPFTAPFQTWDVDNTAPAPLELLPAFQADTALCLLVPARVFASHPLKTAPLAELFAVTSLAGWCAPVRVACSVELTSLMGDYSIQTAVLRL